jgi:hypothetical protein
VIAVAPPTNSPSSQSIKVAWHLRTLTCETYNLELAQT